MSSWLYYNYKRPPIKKLVELSQNITNMYDKLKGLTIAKREMVEQRDLRDPAKVRTYRDTNSIKLIDKSSIYYDTSIRMFNAGLIVQSGDSYGFTFRGNDNNVWMIYRECPFTYDRNAAILCKVDINTLETSDFKDICEYTELGNNEDIRFFTFSGELYISYTHNYNMKISKFSVETGEMDEINFSFDDFPKEKNWTFFDSNGILYGIRYYAPLEIYTIDLEKNSIRLYCKYDWKFPHNCKHIQLRGGAPPILINGKYYIFLHSSITYDIYAMTFDPVTFKPLEYTPDPLFNEIKSYIKFTCGAVYDARAEEWNVCFGIDDLECAFGKIGFAELADLMVPINLDA